MTKTRDLSKFTVNTREGVQWRYDPRKNDLRASGFAELPTGFLASVTSPSLPPFCLDGLMLYKKNWIKWSETYFQDKTNTHLTNIRWAGYFIIYLNKKE